MISNRGIYHEGWYANTTPPHGPWLLNVPIPEPENYRWELYNLTMDYSQRQCRLKSPQKCRLKIPHLVAWSVCVEGVALPGHEGCQSRPNPFGR